MCEFVTATFPAGADMVAMQSVASEFKRGFELLVNRSLSTQLPPGEHVVCLTTGMCDCGTVIGDFDRAAGTIPDVPESELKKLRRKGWSEAKLARWKEQRRQNSELRAHEKEAYREGKRSEAAEWVAFIDALLATKRTSHVGLLCHTYSGSLEGETITLKRTVVVHRDGLMSQAILETERDVLYVFSC